MKLCIVIVLILFVCFDNILSKLKVVLSRKLIFKAMEPSLALMEISCIVSIILRELDLVTRKGALQRVIVIEICFPLLQFLLFDCIEFQVEVKKLAILFSK